MINVRIFNTDDVEVTEDSLDMALGRLVPDVRISKHVPASPYIPPVTHSMLSAVYFVNGEKYEITGEDDPHLSDDKQDFVRLDGEYQLSGDDYEPYYIFGRDYVTIIDVPEMPEVLEHNEYENIYRYIPYTDDDLARIESANNREEFLGGAPDRLTNVETSAEEAQSAIAELGTIADEAATNAEDLMDASAELGAIVEENGVSIEDLMNAIAELGAIVAGE